MCIRDRNYLAPFFTFSDDLRFGATPALTATNPTIQIKTEGQVIAKGFTANNFPYDSSIIPLQISADTTIKDEMATFSSGFGGQGTITAAVIYTDGTVKFARSIVTGNDNASGLEGSEFYPTGQANNLSLIHISEPTRPY